MYYIWFANLGLAQPQVAPTGVAMKPCGEQREGMACIPGGPFLRGSTQEHRCEQSENRRNKTQFGPQDTVWVQTFYIDKTEACTRLI